ncbi:MAG TPA: M28 family peptidase, partial [Polyangiaceae bacterium]|nr:M28 family peptidase [Polyangiaceae bacterium]
MTSSNTARRLVIPWCLLALSACQSQAPVTSPAITPVAPPSARLEAAPSPAELSAATGAITADYLRTQITRLSADELAGRGPATEGDRGARAYLRRELQALGAEPGFAKQAWEQPVELVSVKAAFPAAWTFQHGTRAVSLGWWDEYIAGSGVHVAQSSVDDAELVFAGYGIQAPEYGWDDFKGQDLKGKLLLLLNNDPDWDPALFAGTTRLYYGRWMYKYESAARQGAVGALIVHTRDSAGYPFQVVQSSWGGEVFDLPSASESPLRVKGWVTEEAAGKLARLAGRELRELVGAARSKDFVPVRLGVTTSARFQNEIHRVESANVLGVVRGSDPRLADEYVVLSAHHDHLGIGKADARGDTIYNGAVDNGAGLATVLGITKALRALPKAPRRSVLVLFVTAEEQGLLGSKFFGEHPSVNPAKIVADLNYDCGNIWGKTRDVSQVGYGKSSVDELVRKVAARQNRVVVPDQFPDRGSFYRSDQLNFARLGVPAIYLKTGTDFIGRPEGWGKQQILEYETHRYHQPSDEISADFNFDGLVEDAQLGFLIA